MTGARILDQYVEASVSPPTGARLLDQYVEVSVSPPTGARLLDQYVEVSVENLPDTATPNRRKAVVAVPRLLLP